MLPLSGGMIEVCGGLGALSSAYQFHGLDPEVIYETAQFKQRILRHLFPTSKILGDANAATAKDFNHERPIWHVAGGPECAAVSNGGKMLGLDDERTHTTVNAIPTIAALVNAISFTIENVAAICSTKNA